MIFQFKVQLQDIDPPIWRQFQTSNEITFHQLHKILQIVMGWQESHLYEFDLGKKTIALPDPELGFGDQKDLNAKREQLKTHLRVEGQAITYIYDFGDYWEHRLTLERILDKPTDGPLCLGGERSAPPEDCGGVGGYEEILRVIADPNDPEYESILEWLRDDYDPEEFDLEYVNGELTRRKASLSPAKKVVTKSEKPVKLTKAKLKKWLQSLTQEETTELLTRCFAMNKEVEQFLTVRCYGEEAIEELSRVYSKKVEDEFFPDRGEPKLRLSEAKKAIDLFEKITQSPRHVIDLRLLFVENGVEFTRSYGDIDARFYDSVLKMYASIVKMVSEDQSRDLFDEFEDRIYSVVERSWGIGWGFHDGLVELYSYIQS